MVGRCAPCMYNATGWIGACCWSVVSLHQPSATAVAPGCELGALPHFAMRPCIMRCRARPRSLACPQNLQLHRGGDGSSV